MKPLTIVCLSALLALSAASEAFAWGAMAGPRGGAAVRTPSGAAAVPRTLSGRCRSRSLWRNRRPWAGLRWRHEREVRAKQPASAVAL